MCDATTRTERGPLTSCAFPPPSFGRLDRRTSNRSLSINGRCDPANERRIHLVSRFSAHGRTHVSRAILSAHCEIGAHAEPRGRRNERRREGKSTETRTFKCVSAAALYKIPAQYGRRCASFCLGGCENRTVGRLLPQAHFRNRNTVLSGFAETMRRLVQPTNITKPITGTYVSTIVSEPQSLSAALTRD